jgi:hypothetical protein
MLQYAYEDEIMAKYEYEQLIETFGISNPFVNIIKAETRHIEAVLNLYNYYDLEVQNFDPSLYVVIPETIEEIYNIGVEAEIKNITMYEVFLGQELSDNVRNVFLSLQKGSEYHLAAFEKGGVCDENPVASGNQGNGKSAGRGMNQGKGNARTETNENCDLTGEGNNVQINRGQGSGSKGNRNNGNRVR